MRAKKEYIADPTRSMANPIVAARLPFEMIAEIDAWSRYRALSRSEGIARMIKRVLSAGKTMPRRADERALAAYNISEIVQGLRVELDAQQAEETDHQRRMDHLVGDLERHVRFLLAATGL